MLLGYIVVAIFGVIAVGKPVGFDASTNTTIAARRILERADEQVVKLARACTGLDSIAVDLTTHRALCGGFDRLQSYSLEIRIREAYKNCMAQVGRLYVVVMLAGDAAKVCAKAVRSGLEDLKLECQTLGNDMWKAQTLAQHTSATALSDRSAGFIAMADEHLKKCGQVDHGEL